MGGGSLAVAAIESAKRELKEETGLTASNWEYLHKLHTSNSVTDEVGLVFLATELQLGSPSFDESEALEIRRLPFEEAVSMVLRNEITEAVSAAGLLFLAMQRSNRRNDDEISSLMRP